MTVLFTSAIIDLRPFRFLGLDFWDFGLVYVAANVREIVAVRLLVKRRRRDAEAWWVACTALVGGRVVVGVRCDASAT